MQKIAVEGVLAVKKWITFCAVEAAVAVVCCCLWGLWLFPEENGTLTYVYGDRDIHVILTKEETAAVCRILNGKWMYEDNPSCGFSENISITVDGVTLALACDSCGQMKNCGNGKYVFLFPQERQTIEDIFQTYGGKFPCV